MNVRIKKQFFWLIPCFFFLLLVSDIGFVASLPAEGGVSDAPPSQPLLSVNAEQENVDSFNVNPSSGRWNVDINSFTSGIENGILNLTDTGDGSADTYQITRDLRKLDSKIKVRFRYNISDDSSNTRDELRIYMRGADAFAETVLFRVNKLQDNDFSTTALSFETDSLAGSGSETFAGTERVFEGLWYIYELKYDMLESEAQVTLSHDNGTRVFRRNLFDISTDVPLIFGKEALDIHILAGSRQSGLNVELNFDYVNAPFKEREWKNVEVPVGFLGNAWDACRAEDNIDDQSRWQLTVPLLDMVSGLMSIDYTNFGSFIAGDETNFEFRVFAVDANDGDLHEIVKIRIFLGGVVVGATLSLTLDGGDIIYTRLFTIVDGQVPGVSFSMSLREDRAEFSVKARYFLDVKDNTAGYDDVSGSVDIASVATDPSQEFVLEFDHDHDYDGNIEMNSFVSDFAFQERDIFTGIVQGIQGFFETLILSIVNIFATVFRFIAVIFVFVGDLIVVALATLQSALEVALTALGGLIEAALTALGVLLEAAIEALEPFLTVISDAVDALWTLFIDTLDDIITALIALASDFTDFFFDVLELLIPLLIGFLGTIISSIIDLAAGLLFFVWDALSLPDLLAILDLIAVHSVTFITEFIAALTDVIQVLIDVSWIPLVLWWAYAVPFQFAKAAFEPLAGLGNTIEVYFQNLTPVAVGGFQLYFPVGIFATVWLLVLLPADFIGFTALP